MQRAISAVVLIPLILLLIYYANPIHYSIAVGAISLLALGEFYALAEKTACRLFKPVGYLGSVAITFSLYKGHSALDYVIIGLLIVSFTLALKEIAIFSEALKAVAVTFLGPFYTSYLLGLLIPIRFDLDEGQSYTLFLLATIWAGDIAAYAVGSRWGRTKLAPDISPKKTVEGAVAGLVASAITATLLRYSVLKQLGWLEVILLGLIIGLLGQAGDLAESILKRGAQVKDSSTLLPGHGGVLDRIDSLLFATPAMYVYLRIWHAQ